MLLSLWLSSAAVAAPTHLRAIALPPESLAALEEPRPVALYWDAPWPEPAAPVRVELRKGEFWRELTDQATPGWVSPPLPIGSQLRILDALGPSEVIPVQWGLDAASLSAMAWPGQLPGLEAADIAPIGQQGAWVALLDGGLVRADKAHLEVQTWGVAQGLPSAQVNAVAIEGERVWVGSSAGLAVIEGGAVQRVWDDALSDPWVQVLAAHPQGGAWVGSYKGLDHLALNAQVTPLLGPRSVFSLSVGRDERQWVGYAGLHGLPQGEPIEGVSPDINVWDIDTHDPGQILLATDTQGILRLREGVLSPYWMPESGAVYALERIGPLLYAAVEGTGVVALEGPTPVAVWGIPQGLPAPSAYEVIEGPKGKLWIGSAGGLSLFWPRNGALVSWPTSPAPAGRAVLSVLGWEEGALLATPDGLAAIGELPRRYRDALALPGPIVSVLEQTQGKSLWVVGPRDAWRVRRNKLERFPLPTQATHAAVHGGLLWVGSADGLYRHDGGLERFVPTDFYQPVQDLAVGPGGRLWVASGARVMSVDLSGASRDYLEAGRALGFAVDAGGLWVRTPVGLQRLDPLSGKAHPVPAFQDLELLSVACGGPPAERSCIALDAELRLRRIPDGERILGTPELWTLGSIEGLQVDPQGRIWVLGERGAALVPDPR